MSDINGRDSASQTRFRGEGRRKTDERGGAERSVNPESARPNLDGHRRLLAVEDNPEMQKLFYHFLSPRWDVYSAYDMKTAMQLAGKISFDVILMDINLGEATTGVDVLHALRKMPRYANTPIVAVTAYALPGDRERFLADGFDAYIGKPFAKQQLVRMLEQIGVA